VTELRGESPNSLALLLAYIQLFCKITSSVKF